MTFPCLFSSPVPHQYACYVFSPRHKFLVTETQKTNQWEEHRRKQEAGRGEKSSFFLLRLSLVFSCSHYSRYRRCACHVEAEPALFCSSPSFIWLFVTTDGKEKQIVRDRDPKNYRKGNERSETKSMERPNTVCQQMRSR